MPRIGCDASAAVISLSVLLLTASAPQKTAALGIQHAKLLWLDQVVCERQWQGGAAQATSAAAAAAAAKWTRQTGSCCACTCPHSWACASWQQPASIFLPFPSASLRLHLLAFPSVPLQLSCQCSFFSRLATRRCTAYASCFPLVFEQRGNAGSGKWRTCGSGRALKHKSKKRTTTTAIQRRRRSSRRKGARPKGALHRVGEPAGAVADGIISMTTVQPTCCTVP